MQAEVFLKSGKALVIDQFADYIPPGATGSVADVLCAIADRWAADYWDIGRVTNALIAQAKSTGLPVAEYHIYEAVAEWLHHEVAWQTVRYYAKTAEWYQNKDIDKYMVLPFSHFALAMSYPEWQVVLDLAMMYMDAHYGKFPSRNWLIAALSGRLDERNSADFDASLPNSEQAYVMSAEDVIGFDETVADAPGGEGNEIGIAVLQSLGGAASKVIGMIGRIPVAGRYKERLEILLRELVDLISEIDKT